MDRKQHVAIVAAPVLVLSMLGVYRLLAKRLGAKQAWYVGFWVYWSVWCLGFPLWLLGFKGLQSLFDHRRPGAFDGFVLIVPPALSIFGRHSSNDERRRPFERGALLLTAPVFPMLFAAGAVWWEQALANLARTPGRVARGISWALVAVGGALVLALGPYWPANSAQFRTVSEINADLKEEIGWPELVQTVAGIYDGLPAADRPGTAVFAGNYGVAGAVDLYGPAAHLPGAISPVNSYWLRGYGDPPPQTVIVVGVTGELVDRFFSDCRVAGHVANAYDVPNEEVVNHPDIFVCRSVRLPWPLLWQHIQGFG